MSQAQDERRNAARMGFVGAGSMGGALVRGLLAAGLVKPADLVFYDPDPRLQQALEKLGVGAALDNAAVMQAPVVVLAVKPQVLRGVLKEIRDHARPGQVVISIAAGVPLAVLEEALPDSRVIRAMPNTPLMVQAGMTALAPGSRATDEDMGGMSANIRQFCHSERSEESLIFLKNRDSSLRSAPFRMTIMV
jgi:pyrroline-5-carboxylate reductase